MALPPGRLLSLPAHTQGRPGASLTISFDQARHVGAGQRPGSWMAVSARLPGQVPPDQLRTAWRQVIERHSSLRTVFSRTVQGSLELRETKVVLGDWAEHHIDPGQDPRQVLRALFDRTCAPFDQPSHRLALLLPSETEADRRPVVIVGSDHAHVDMWSLLVVLRDLLQGLDNLRAGRPVDAGMEAVAGFTEHSAAMAARPSAPERIHRRWAEILDAGQGLMPRFGLPLGTDSPEEDSAVEVRDIFDAEQCERFAAHAASLGVRMIALAVSALTVATRELSGTPLRAVFPVHSRYEPRWRDSVGWFITDSVIESSDPDPQACARAVKEAIDLGSHPLGPILEPYGGMPVGPGMFALSWLDTRRLAELPSGAQVQYVSAAVHDDGVMVWFVVNPDGLHLRARYPDNPVAAASMTRWLDAVASGLRGFLD